MSSVFSYLLSFGRIACFEWGSKVKPKKGLPEGESSKPRHFFYVALMETKLDTDKILEKDEHSIDDEKFTISRPDLVNKAKHKKAKNVDNANANNQVKPDNAIKYAQIEKAVKKETKFLDQLNTLVSVSEITPEDYAARQVICDQLKKIPGVKEVHQFGSSVNGLGFRGCDLDVYILMTDDEKDPQKTDLERAKKKVRKVSGWMYKKPMNFQQIAAITSAKVPIVQAVHKASKISCDLSFRNKLSVLNSNFIAKLTEFDARVRPFCMGLRFVAKDGGLIQSGKSNRFSSYAFTLMIIFYLQIVKIIPSVKEFQENVDKVYIEGWNVAYNEDASAVPKPKADKELSFQELFAGFFAYYRDFDLEANMICPYLGEPVPKAAFPEPETQARFPNYAELVAEEHKGRELPVDKPVVVQDPFEFVRNCTANIVSICHWTSFCETICELVARKATSFGLLDLCSLPAPNETMSKKARNLASKAARKMDVPWLDKYNVHLDRLYPDLKHLPLDPKDPPSYLEMRVKSGNLVLRLVQMILKYCLMLPVEIVPGSVIEYVHLFLAAEKDAVENDPGEDDDDSNTTSKRSHEGRIVTAKQTPWLNEQHRKSIMDMLEFHRTRKGVPLTNGNLRCQVFTPTWIRRLPDNGDVRGRALLDRERDKAKEKVSEGKNGTCRKENKYLDLNFTVLHRPQAGKGVVSIACDVTFAKDPAHKAEFSLFIANFLPNLIQELLDDTDLNLEELLKEVEKDLEGGNCDN